MRKAELHSVAYNKLSNAHIPYFSYALIKDDDGLIYVVDEFNMGIIIGDMYQGTAIPFERLQNILVYLVSTNQTTLTYIHNAEYSSDCIVKLTSLRLNAEPLIRLDGINTAHKIAGVLDFNLDNYVSGGV